MKKKMEQFADEDGVVAFKEFMEFPNGKVIRDGVEYPDQTPIELPIGYSHPPTIQQMIAQMVRQELEMREEMGDDVSEADREEDFDIDEDGEELLTPYELHAAAAEEARELRARGVKMEKAPPKAGPKGSAPGKDVLADSDVGELVVEKDDSGADRGGVGGKVAVSDRGKASA